MSHGQRGEIESEALFPLVSRLAGNTPLEVQLSVPALRAQATGLRTRMKHRNGDRVYLPQAPEIAHSKWEKNRFIEVALPFGCSAILLQCTAGFLVGYENTENKAEKRNLLERVVSSEACCLIKVNSCDGLGTNYPHKCSCIDGLGPSASWVGEVAPPKWWVTKGEG